MISEGCLVYKSIHSSEQIDYYIRTNTHLTSWQILPYPFLSITTKSAGLLPNILIHFFTYNEGATTERENSWWVGGYWNDHRMVVVTCSLCISMKNLPVLESDNGSTILVSFSWDGRNRTEELKPFSTMQYSRNSPCSQKSRASIQNRRVIN